MRLRPVGERALLVELDNLAEVRGYYAQARGQQASGALPATVEIVPAARTLLFDDVDDRAELVARLRSWGPAAGATATGRSVEVPVVYDGPDLEAVAELWGVSCARAVELHTGLSHEVAFVGFSPGFAYIAGLGDALRVPRLPRPRSGVPGGSVAIADEFTGIYPRQSPGGWRLIGRTDLSMWDPRREPVALLSPGDTVRFVPVES